MPLTEDEFKDQVKALSKICGWLYYHTYDSRRSDAGFPDVTIARCGVLLFRELKTDTGRVSTSQQAWLNAINSAGGNAKVWRPRDWDEIERTLGGRQ